MKQYIDKAAVVAEIERRRKEWSYGSHIFEDSYEEAVEAALKYCLENLI